MADVPKYYAPKISVTISLNRQAKNPVGIHVSIWINGSRKDVWGEGATIDEAWDWAKNSLEARYGANRDMLDAFMPLYNVRIAG